MYTYIINMIKVMTFIYHRRTGNRVTKTKPYQSQTPTIEDAAALAFSLTSVLFLYEFHTLAYISSNFSGVSMSAVVFKSIAASSAVSQWYMTAAENALDPLTLRSDAHPIA
jgi:hypothetical protein